MQSYLELNQFTFGRRARSDCAVYSVVLKTSADLARLIGGNPCFHVLHEEKKNKNKTKKTDC